MNNLITVESLVIMGVSKENATDIVKQKNAELKTYRDKKERITVNQCFKEMGYGCIETYIQRAISVNSKREYIINGRVVKTEIVSEELKPKFVLSATRFHSMIKDKAINDEIDKIEGACWMGLKPLYTRDWLIKAIDKILEVYFD